MRIMVTINGKVSVHEILEFEPQEDGTVLITTAEGCMDLIVKDMNEARMAAVCRELLRDGYANIEEYTTVYDEVFEDTNDDDMELYSAVCPECGEAFEFEMTPQAAALGVIICPHCGEELEFDMNDEDGPALRLLGAENELAYEATCPQCHMTVDVSQQAVNAGSMICPICKANLLFDAIDAENGTLGDYEEDEDE